MLADQTPLGVDASTPRPSRVDEGDVGSVESLEVLVVEARSLAELPIPGLEAGGGRRVPDDGVHPVPDLLHLLEVGLLQNAGQIRSGPPDRSRSRVTSLPDDVRPAVHHQVLSAKPPEVRRVKFSILSRCHPGWSDEAQGGLSGGSPDVDGRWRALEDEQLPGRLGDVGNDLDGRGPGPDDADALARQARRPPSESPPV